MSCDKAWSKRDFYISREGISETGTPRTGALGLYWPNDADHDPHRPEWEEVVGRFGSCLFTAEAIAQLWAENPDGIYMASGYCHYTYDHYIVPGEFLSAEGPAQFRRLAADSLLGPAELVIGTVETDAEREQQQNAATMFNALSNRDLISTSVSTIRHFPTITAPGHWRIMTARTLSTLAAPLRSSQLFPRGWCHVGW